MKNSFKFGFLALAISLSVAACGSNENAESADSTVVDTATVIDTTMAAPVDTISTTTTTTDSIAQ